MAKTKKQEVEINVPEKVAHAMELAKKTAIDLFGEVDGKKRSTINGIFDRCYTFFDDDLDLKMPDVTEAVADLQAAQAWAGDVYGETTPEATFDAFDRAFEVEGDDDDEE